jgi:hypothetical protein
MDISKVNPFMNVYSVKKFKAPVKKTVPVTDREGPQRYERSRPPPLLDSRLIDGGKVVSLTRRPPFYTPGKFLGLISVRG